MADLLTRTAPDARGDFVPGAETWRVVNGKKEPFNLVDRLRDGSVVFAGSGLIRLNEARPWVDSAADKKAVELATRLGYDLALATRAPLDHPVVPIELGEDYFVVQYFVETRR